jgi:hypothetical protein
MKNENVKQVVKVVTIAGSAVLVLNSAMRLMKAGTSMNLKGAVMPSVSILVGLAAFNYAMQDKPMLKK